MGSKIIVAGAGHGGIIAAYHLAQNGYDVTVFEMKSSLDELGYDWEDAFDIEAFEAAEIPVYPDGIKDCVDIWFHGPKEDEVIIQNRHGRQNVRMFRKDLYRHIVTLAESAGVKFQYGVKVLSPLMLGNRVAGVKTDKGDFYCDLVIDSAGVNSPVRENLPESLGIKNHMDYPEVLTAYRAYYNKTADCEDSYHVYFLDEGGRGLNWVITQGESVDVLLGRLSDFYDGEIDEYVAKLRELQPQLGDKVIRGAQVCKIPVRQLLGVMVADGYAAIGDCACMTVPLLGSGIYYSFCAGKMLADTILEDENCFFSAATLYPYQKKFFSEFASSNATITILKRMLTSLSFEEVEFFMSGAVISSDDVLFANNEPNIKSFIDKYIPSELVRKIKNIKGRPDFVSKMKDVVKRLSIYKAISVTMPNEYNYDDIIKWSNRYEQFFEKIYSD